MKPRVKPVFASDIDIDALLASLMEEWPLLLSEPVPPKVARAHIAKAAAATALSVPRSAVAPSARPPLRARWRRRFVLATVTSTFVGQLLIGTAAVAAVGAGAAAAGVLPSPLQSAVSELAGEVGLVLPSGTESATPADPGEPGQGATPASPAVPPGRTDTTADPQQSGLVRQPVTPPGLGEFADLREAVEAIRADRFAGNGPEATSGPPETLSGPPETLSGAPETVPGPPETVPGPP
ncbi:MAG: hypothetical protein ACE5MI_13760 [Acidimicrobiia bacterium]